MSEILRVENLTKHFPVKVGLPFSRGRRVVKAVDGVSFTMDRGETLGLVGESGCGKTTTGRLILRLEDATAGRVVFDGEDVSAYRGSRLRALRKRMQIVFQDPYSSLNPRMTVGEIVGEPLVVHKAGARGEREAKVKELLEIVGLQSEHFNRYPHEFSGGQRQRVGIARALILRPELIVCDEPVSALDVSIRAQIINLLKSLQKEYGLTYLFISHDLSVVRHVSDRIAVMYLGGIVEVAESKSLFERPAHPYTKALLDAIPVPDPLAEKAREFRVLEGDVGLAAMVAEGCKFRDRCPIAVDRCGTEAPSLKEIADGHLVACFLSVCDSNTRDRATSNRI